MASASVPPYGFMTARGRGYRPAQVERFTAVLAARRDAAWERAARLTAQVKELEAEAARLREAVVGLRPQTYGELGERAQAVFRLAREEAGAVWEAGRREAKEQGVRALECAVVVRREAEEAARELCARAEADAVRRVEAARAEAEEIRVAARREIKEGRGEVLSGLREVRRRTEELKAGRGEGWEARERQLERELAEGEREFESRQAALLSAAEQRLTEATQSFSAAQHSARRLQTEARTHATELLDTAHHQADRIARETEAVLREHGERWDDVRAHMDYVRSSLSALTGRAVE